MHLRILALAALLSSSVAVAGTHLELEVGAGASGLPDKVPPTAASFSGRVGLDLWDFLTPSIRFVTATPLTNPLPPYGSTAGWRVLGEVRLHTSGVFQLTGGLAFGVASASMLWTAANTGQDVGAYLSADIGVRLKFGPFFVGVGVGGSPWVSPHWETLANVGVSLFD
jgi:hypothetical protein